MRTYSVRYEGLTLNVVGQLVCHGLPIPTALTSELEEILVGDVLPDTFDPEPWRDPDNRIVY